jgi:DNA-binding MarR family transcriptional regulator
MEQREVDTIAGLARELGATRPSVSRAVNALVAGGFVSKVGDKWALTEAGEEEARRLRERQPGQPERDELRPLIEALNSFADSAKDLERISEQLQLLIDLTESAPQPVRDDVHHLRLVFDEVRTTMEPLEGIAEQMEPLLGKFGSSEEMVESLGLDSRDRRLLARMGHAYKAARWALERISDEMENFEPLIDKLRSAQEGGPTTNADRSTDALTSGPR